MAAFMHFWRMSEPRQYLDLDLDELAAMERYRDRVRDAQKTPGR